MTLYKESNIWVTYFHLNSSIPFFYTIYPGKEKLKTTYAGWHNFFSLSKDVSWQSPCCSAAALSLLTWPAGYTEGIVSLSSSFKHLPASGKAHPLAVGCLWKPMNSSQWRNYSSQMVLDAFSDPFPLWEWAVGKEQDWVYRLLNSRCYWLLANHGCNAACRFMGWKHSRWAEINVPGQEWEGRWSWGLPWNFW